MKKTPIILFLALLTACNNSSDYDTTTTDSVSKSDTIVNTPFDSGKSVSRSGNPDFKDTTSHERESAIIKTDSSK